MTTEFRLEHRDLAMGISYAADNFESAEGKMICEQSAHLAARGDDAAFFVPAVRIVIDAALKTLSLAKFEESLSKEIIDRQLSLRTVAAYISNIFVDKDSFTRLYQENAALNRAGTRRMLLVHLRNGHYLESLVSTPFQDAAKACGGALNVLRQTDMDTDIPARIAESTNLLAVSGIAKPVQRKAQQFLGSTYVRTDLLEIAEEAGTVRFTEAAMKRLRTYMGPDRGCPASRMQGLGPASVLADYWPQFVTALVPEGATADSTS